MREHGVIRRALLVYAELADKVRKSSASVDAASLRKAAQLFRTFGEDYHERMLEEEHIFPVVRKMKSDKVPRCADGTTPAWARDYRLHSGGDERATHRLPACRASGARF